MSKVCSKCGTEKLDECFSKSSCRKGLRSWCKTCEAERSKKQRESNPTYLKQYRETNKAKLAEYDRKWSNDNAIKKAQNCKKWRRGNLEYFRLWAIRNRDKNNVNEQKRRMRKKLLSSTLTNDQWLAIKEVFSGKCCYCGKDTAITKEHLVPLGKGGGYTRDNIVPACQSCNSSKRDKNFSDWYPKQPFYNKDRELLILKI